MRCWIPRPKDCRSASPAKSKASEGVLSTERVRVRRAGNQHFVDVTISVPRSASFEQVHAISDAVERRVGEIVPADVMVHMEPRAQVGEHLFDAIRVIAARLSLAVHEISADQLDGRLFIAKCIWKSMKA